LTIKEEEYSLKDEYTLKDRISLVDLLGGDKGISFINKDICIAGWIRTMR